jgi:multiphosphoryl transfer protein
VEEVSGPVEPAPVSGTGPVGASPGIAIGPARRLTLPEIDPGETVTGEPGAEWRRVVEAVAQVRREIEHLRALTVREVGEAEAGIFDAHLTLLADAALLADVKQRTGEGVGALRAWTECLDAIEREWSELPDAYLRERAADVGAVRDQVRRVLAGGGTQPTVAEGILVARDLTPAEAAALDTSTVHGIVLAAGSATSHAAILARSRDLPLVVSAGRDILAVPEGTLLVVDGAAGEVHVDPGPDVVEDHRRRAAELAARRTRDLSLASEPAATRDGTPVTVAANLGSVADARAAFAAGADEAGLVRTEFLFLGRGSAPDVAEQEAEYVAIAEALGGRRSTLRTLDVGGDKPLAYLPMPAEENPFLGVRGIRLCFAYPELFRTQLRAIFRAAAHGPVKIMYPMIATVADLREAQAITESVRQELGAERLETGIMIEVPSAVIMAPELAVHADFFSIGTNDLTQYVLAMDRGHPQLARQADGLHPAVLRMIDQTVRATEGRNAWVGVCGGVAGDPLGALILIGLGVTELSVSIPSIAAIKARVRGVSMKDARNLARRALACDSAEAVRELVTGRARAGS